MTKVPAPEATGMLCALLGPLPTGVRARAYFDDVAPEPGTVALWAEVEWDAAEAVATAREPVATRQCWALAMGGDVAAAVRLMTDAVDRLRGAAPALLCTCRGVGACPVHHVTTTVPMREGVLDLSTQTITMKPLTSYPGPDGTTVHPPGSPLVKRTAGTFGLHEGSTIVEDPRQDPMCPTVLNLDSWQIASIGNEPTIVNDDGLTHVRTEERAPFPGMFDAIRRQLTAPLASETLQDLTRLRALVADIWTGCSECGSGEDKAKALAFLDEMMAKAKEGTT
jgi:hypothetical protein